MQWWCRTECFALRLIWPKATSIPFQQSYSISPAVNKFKDASPSTQAYQHEAAVRPQRPGRSLRPAKIRKRHQLSFSLSSGASKHVAWWLCTHVMSSLGSPLPPSQSSSLIPSPSLPRARTRRIPIPPIPPVLLIRARRLLTPARRVPRRLHLLLTSRHPALRRRAPRTPGPAISRLLPVKRLLLPLVAAAPATPAIVLVLLDARALAASPAVL